MIDYTVSFTQRGPSSAPSRFLPAASGLAPSTVAKINHLMNDTMLEVCAVMPVFLALDRTHASDVLPIAPLSRAARTHSAPVPRYGCLT